MISFVKGHKDYSDEELNYGPILLRTKDKVFIEKYEEINKKLSELLDKIDVKNTRYNEIKKEIERNTLIISK